MRHAPYSFAILLAALSPAVAPAAPAGALSRTVDASADDNACGLPIVRNAGPTLPSRGATRGREADFDLSLLTESAASRPVVLNLFDDLVLPATKPRVTHRSTGSSTWSAKVSADSGPEALRAGDAVIVVENGIIEGAVAVGGRMYRIQTLSSGRQSIREVDGARFPPEGQPIPIRGEAPSALEPAAAAENGSLIDVMIVYTAAAAADAGGNDAINAQAQLAIDSTNQAYANSAIRQRLRLAYAGEVNYAETGDAQVDLDRLQAGGDGLLDEVPGLRAAHHADLVSLWEARLSGSECGLGFLMATVSPSFADHAFSVVERDCAVDNLSFAHELGHNMGAQHDRANAQGSGAFPFSYGYQQPSGAFRTIMAYQNGCVLPCPRILNFSNPATSENGVATGVDDAAPNSADNARTLDQTAATVAAFTESAGTLSNLVPWALQGLSDRVVVSKSVSSTVDTHALFTTDSLFAAWAVGNAGDAAASGPFFVDLLVDGAVKSTMPVNVPLNPGDTASATGIAIGKLTSGPHTIAVKADSTNAVPESNEDDNLYAKTIDVFDPAHLPNLAPYKPQGWSDKIVVSSTKGGVTGGTSFKDTDELFVDWALTNNGTTATSARFSVYFFVDGLFQFDLSPDVDADFKPGFFVDETGISIGTLPPGSHVLKLVADSTDSVVESNETDNTFTKTITVVSTGGGCPVPGRGCASRVPVSPARSVPGRPKP